MRNLVKLIITLSVSLVFICLSITASENVNNETGEFLDNFSKSLETFAKKGKPTLQYLSNLNIVYSPYGDNELKQCSTYLGNIDKLPYWLKGLGWSREPAKNFQDADEKHIPELIKILKTYRTPEIQALAIRWLSLKRDINHIELVEKFLDSDKESAFFPFVNWYSNSKMYPINWCKLKISEIALIALRTITYRNFPRVWGYKYWRKNNPDISKSFDYWYYAIHLNTSVEKSAGMLEKLIKQNLPLALRVLYKGMKDPYSRLSKKTSYHLFKKLVSKEQIFALLSEKVPSEYFPEDMDKQNFISWVMSYPGTLFSKNDSQKLYRLWLDEPHNQNYAYAAFMLNREKQREILIKTIRLTRGKTKPFFLEKLAKLYSFQEYEILEESFFTENNTSKILILKSIPFSKIKNKAILKKLNDDSRFRKIEERLIFDELQKDLFFTYLDAAKKSGFSLSKLLSSDDFYPKHLTKSSLFGTKKIKKDTREFQQAREKRLKAIEMIKAYLNGI